MRGGIARCFWRKKVKIAVIGNSHIASLKRGYETLSRRSAHELVFFGGRGLALKDMEVDDCCLVPTSNASRKSISFTSGGIDRINVNDFDAFLLYGLEAKALIVPQSRFYSDAVIRRSAYDVVHEKLCYEILLKLRSITEKPIFIGHNPLRGAHKKPGNSDTSSYERGIEYLNQIVYAHLNALVIPQPKKTIVHGDSTDILYAQGSKRLAIGDDNDDALHPTIDVTHMNDAFGALWLKSFFKKI